MPISRDRPGLATTSNPSLQRPPSSALQSAVKAAPAVAPDEIDAARRAAAQDAATPPLRAAIGGAPRAKVGGAGARGSGVGVDALQPAPKKPGVLRRNLRKAVAAAALGIALLGGVLSGGGAFQSQQPHSALQVRVMQMHKPVQAHDTVAAFDVAPLARLAGMTDAELARSVSRADLTATVDAEQRIDVHGGVLVIPAGARITASLDSYGLRISASPALSFERDWKLDAQVESVTYRFAEGKLDVDASGLGPDALYSKAATKQANDALLHLLPAELRTPGFDPHDIGHIQLLHRTIAGLVGSDTSPRVAGNDDVGDEIAKVVSSWSASVVLEPVKEIRGGLHDDITLTIKKDSRLDIRVDATMQGGRPVVESVSLSTMTGDGPVVQKGDSKMKSLELQHLTLTRDPNATSADSAFKVSAGYSLEAESSIKGVIALFGALVGAARGGSPEMGAAAAVHRAGDVKLTGARAQIDEGFQQLSAPVARLLSQLHVAAPGIGLDSLHNVAGADSTARAAKTAKIM